MNIDESKQVFLALFEKEIPKSMQMDCTEIVEQLKHADSASEMAACIVKQFKQIEESYGQAFLDTVKASLSAEVWKQCGVLFNPVVIPDTGQEAYHVIADGSVKTIQDKQLKAYYYGDVNLSVTNGRAYVYDSKHPVSVEQNGVVMAYGHTQVTGNDFNYVVLHEKATAIVEGDGTVWAEGDSFVESKSGYPQINVSGQAQFVVSGGSATIDMSGSARGVVLTKGDDSHPMKISFRGEGVLYTPNQEASSIKFLRMNKLGVVLRQPFSGTTHEEMMHLIVPRFYRKDQASQKQIAEPLAMDRLKVDLLPYLPEWKGDDDRNRFERAADENALCEVLVDYLPEMVQKGLTGDFLGTHFTEQTLCKNGIYLRDYREPDEFYVHAYKPMYFFGDQLMNTDAYSDTVYGFDNTLIIAKNNHPMAKVGGNATAIAAEGAKVCAYGRSSVFATDQSQIEAHDKASVRLEQTASVIAADEAHIQAYGQSSVNGTGHSKVELYDKSKGLISDHCKTLVAGANNVEAMGQAELAFPTYDNGSKATITQRSDEVSLIGLDSPEAMEKYRATLITETKNRLIGIRR